MSEKKTAQRTYRALQQLGDGKISERLIVATSQAQARGHVTRTSISVEAVSGLEVAQLVAKGVAVEYAVDDPAHQPPLL